MSIRETPMDAMTSEQLAETVKSICGENVELSQSVELLVLAAYSKGREDAFATLGLDPAEFNGADDAFAWSV